MTPRERMIEYMEANDGKLSSATLYDMFTGDGSEGLSRMEIINLAEEIVEKHGKDFNLGE